MSVGVVSLETIVMSCLQKHQYQFCPNTTPRHVQFIATWLSCHSCAHSKHTERLLLLATMSIAIKEYSPFCSKPTEWLSFRYALYIWYNYCTYTTLLALHCHSDFVKLKCIQNLRGRGSDVTSGACRWRGDLWNLQKLVEYENQLIYCTPGAHSRDSTIPSLLHSTSAHNYFQQSYYAILISMYNEACKI